MLRVAMIQTNPQANKAENLLATERLMKQTVKEEMPAVIVLPEMFECMGRSPAEKIAMAEDIDAGEAFGMARQFARDHRLYVHAGSVLERHPSGGAVFNTTCVFDPQGAMVAVYRKINLFELQLPTRPAYREADTVRPGTAIVHYDVLGFRVGCAICYDLRFPLLFDVLAARGCDIIMLPSAFRLETGKDHWEVLCRARAIETQTYIVACNQWGTVSGASGSSNYLGHSIVVDPWGHVVAKASDGVGIASVLLRREVIASAREQLPLRRYAASGRTR